MQKSIQMLNKRTLGGLRPQLRCLRTVAPQQKILGYLDFLSTQKSNDPITNQWYGQPTWETHPKLIEKTEVAPGVQASEFEKRRERLMAKLPDNSVAVLFSAPMRYYSPNVFYPFRQDANFYYMTGWNEPNSVLVLEKSKLAKRGYVMTMYCMPKDYEKEKWDGPRNGIECAVEMFGADQAFSISEFSIRAKKLLNSINKKGSLSLFVDFVGDLREDKAENPEAIFYKQCKQSLYESAVKVETLNRLVQELRLIKSEAEIKLMQEASDISASGFAGLFSQCKPGMNEDLLQSVFEHYSKIGAKNKSPLTRLAYVPVFAGGDRALVLHYVQNSIEVKDDEMLLVDAGMEYAEYASDITRTFPVNGKFTSAQADLYDAVLEVQVASIKRLSSTSRESLNDIHRFSERLFTEQLKRLGFENHSSSFLRDRLYPHHISHYLGINVHDTNVISRSLELETGMVVTVEPGLYVPYSNDFPKHFQGIGIRIEDDVVIGKDQSSNIVLTRNVPKTRDEIEKAMNLI
ncbi:hypothetical protein BB560_005352 [Smittium megazygosporum]|uniref:Aminopeptidase P N-terminal domain-containing protein n=1 Tax=Smittium megazygosporum TaxID=133381 RepID=A0A2T9Z6Q7_9FUNG|nr:hypothetical protein BB560_005352 [Smittium megazygosporum]